MSDGTLTIELNNDGKLSIKNVGDPLDLWLATRRFFKERRTVKSGTGNSTYPETTNRDVRQLADVWTGIHNRLWRDDLFGAAQHKESWKAARSAIDVAAAGADPSAIFLHNEDFWLRWTKGQAIHLSVARDMPTKWEMVVDSVKEAVVALPENLGRGATAVAEVTASVATKAGEVAAAPVRGVFSGLFGNLGKPLLIGAAIVGGIAVLPRLVAPARPQRGAS